MLDACGSPERSNVVNRVEDVEFSIVARCDWAIPRIARVADIIQALGSGWCRLECELRTVWTMPRTVAHARTRRAHAIQGTIQLRGARLSCHVPGGGGVGKNDSENERQELHDLGGEERS